MDIIKDRPNPDKAKFSLPPGLPSKDWTPGFVKSTTSKVCFYPHTTYTHFQNKFFIIWTKRYSGMKSYRGTEKYLMSYLSNQFLKASSCESFCLIFGSENNSFEIGCFSVS